MRRPQVLPWKDRLFRANGSSALPARIAERINAQEAASEILVGWIQLAVVVGFGVVYMLAPKTFHVDAPFRPVPWVLAAYLLFTFLRLYLAYRNRLLEVLRYASIVVDICLLMGLIWSFHLQYMQPPSFYLKSPTLLYVFIFIALRALLFDSRKVITAGLLAAAGWVFMVLYVVEVDSAKTMVTRDYVHYMTSNSLLVGAEVDKIIAILVVTGILGLAIRRNRRLLTFAVTESDASRELARFVPAEIAAFIKTADVRAGTAEPVEATVLFLDLQDFSTLSERIEPELLVATLNDFYAAVAEPLGRFEGVITQFQGDAILATFNAPRANEKHAANALCAAIAIQDLLARRTFADGLRLRARIGINTGTVVHGMMGTPDRLGYTVIGDEVNIAARLETLNKDYGTPVLVTEQTRERAGEMQFAFTLVDEVQLRGRSTTTRIYSVQPRAAAPMVLPGPV
ncbi:MAG: adenylate/guanylate cyclase domain-containing protein [Casimicrobiaceae bacterium]